MRTLLKIKTIGANDITKAQRIKRRRKQNNAAKRLSRAKAGANSQATSAEQLKPWLALGVSRRTFYRQRANGTVGTVSGTITLSIDGGQSSANRGAPRARARLRGEKELQTSRMVRANASNRIH